MEKSDYFYTLSRDIPSILSFGELSATACQEDIIMILSQKVQEYAELGHPLPYDEEGYPFLEIHSRDFRKKYKKSFILENLIQIMEHSFRYDVLYGDGIPGFCISYLFHHVRNLKNTSRIEVGLIPDSLLFFQRYGKGEYDSKFSCDIALALSESLSKRLYKIICCIANYSVEYSYPIRQFRKDFNIPRSYTNTKIMDCILRPIEEKMRNSDSLIKVSFAFGRMSPIKGGKSKVNTIRIFINNPSLGI